MGEYYLDPISYSSIQALGGFPVNVNEDCSIDRDCMDPPKELNKYVFSFIDHYIDHFEDIKPNFDKSGSLRDFLNCMAFLRKVNDFC